MCVTMGIPMYVLYCELLAVRAMRLLTSEQWAELLWAH